MDVELIRWGVTTLIALLGTSVAFYALSQKLFIKIRSSYQIVKSAMYNDIYVSSVLLINEKDRTEAIHGVYLECDRYIYSQLEEFDSPILLKPYETLNLSFEPVSCYALNTSKVNLNAFLSRPNSLRIVLSTRRGKYRTKPLKYYWKPVYESLKSGRAVAIDKVQTRSSFQSSNSPVISNDAEYLVHSKISGKPIVLQIFTSETKRISNPKYFKLTSSLLENKDALVEHLKSGCFQDHLGNKVEVLSVIPTTEDVEVKGARDVYSDKLDLPNWGALDYYFLVPLYNWIRDIKLNQKNFHPGTFSSFYEKLILSSLPYILILILICIIILSNMNH